MLQDLDKQGSVPILDSVAVIFGCVSNSIIDLRLVTWANNIPRVLGTCFLDPLPNSGVEGNIEMLLASRSFNKFPGKIA